MIDFGKFDITYLSEADLLEIPELEDLWQETFHRGTAELTYPKYASMDNMTFTMHTPRRREISGSLHKYWNIRQGRGSHNHNRFTMEDIEWVVSDLESRFGIIPNQSKIRNIEYGINLHVCKDPGEIINDNIITYKKHPITRLQKFDSKGYFTEVKMSDFSLKVYDKSKQYRLTNHLLRIEVKTRKSRHAKHLKYLSDLLELDKLYAQANDLRKTIQQIKFADRIDPSKFPMNHREATIYLNGINPTYWQHIAENKNLASRRKQFEQVLKKYDLLNMKKEILEAVDYELKQLLGQTVYANSPPLIG